MKVPFCKQVTNYHCGPACIQMLLKHRNVDLLGFSQEDLGHLCRIQTDKGTSAKNINEMLKLFGFKLKSIKASSVLSVLVFAPVLINFDSGPTSRHFAVATGFVRHRGVEILSFHDPYFGKNYRRSFDELKLLRPNYRVLTKLSF